MHSCSISLCDSGCHLVKVAHLHMCFFLASCFHPVTSGLICYGWLDRLDQSPQKWGVHLLDSVASVESASLVLGETGTCEILPHGVLRWSPQSAHSIAEWVTCTLASRLQLQSLKDVRKGAVSCFLPVCDHCVSIRYATSDFPRLRQDNWYSTVVWTYDSGHMIWLDYCN